MFRRTAALAVLGLAGLLPLPSTAAATSSCAYAGGYPGDAGAKIQIAGWMASGAIAAGLPGELPVMAALVESGLSNIYLPDIDSAGYFQMRIAIWNQGAYAGFPTNPDLQLKWFTDQALAVNQQRVAGGLPPYGSDSNGWGEWAADTLRPAAQYRYRYQLRLAEANQLVVGACGGTTIPPSAIAPGPDQQSIDAIKPVLSVGGKRIQDPIGRGAIIVEATCPAEACIAQARAAIPLPGAAKTYRIKSTPRQLAKGAKAKLTLRIRSSLKRKLRSVLERRTLRIKITITARDIAGNTTSVKRVIKLKR